jgi:hypothetical protein
MITTDRNCYGAREVSGLVNGPAYHNDRHQQEGGIESVDWTEPGLEITRLRLISDPGFPAWDVSYCHGMLDGRHVDVQLPFYQLPKRSMRGALYKHAKKTGRFIRGLFDNISTLC